MEEQLSENFNLNEFKVSAEQPEVAKDIEITEEIYENLKKLVKTILQPIRNELKEKIIILSGIRNKKLNSLIGGVNTSDHMYGAATDITSESIRKNCKKIAKMIWDMNLPVRQIIYYPDQKFIHLSINFIDKEFKHELLESKNGKYILISKD